MSIRFVCFYKEQKFSFGKREGIPALQYTSISEMQGVKDIASRKTVMYF